MSDSQFREAKMSTDSYLNPKLVRMSDSQFPEAKMSTD